MHPKRIALCFSGQPRTWAKCYQMWLDLFKGQDTDIFFHFWNYNSPSSLSLHQLGQPTSDIIISHEERQKIVEVLQPKKFEFQTIKHGINVASSYVKTPIAPWAHAQFYSVSKAAWLKRQYEIENNFEYDLVFRMRSDLAISGNIDLPWVEPNTIYTVHNAKCDPTTHTFRIGDIFFAADSFTYDQIAGGFYHAFNYLEANIAVPGFETYPPESALYYFCSSRGIANEHLKHSGDIKIMRDHEHLNRIGELHGYETI